MRLESTLAWIQCKVSRVPTIARCCIARPLMSAWFVTYIGSQVSAPRRLQTSPFRPPARPKSLVLRLPWARVGISGSLGSRPLELRVQVVYRSKGYIKGGPLDLNANPKSEFGADLALSHGYHGIRLPRICLAISGSCEGYSTKCKGSRSMCTERIGWGLSRTLSTLDLFPPIPLIPFE